MNDQEILKQLVDLQKKQLELNVDTMAQAKASQRKKSFRFKFILFALLFWIIGKYISLRQQFAVLFDMYNQSKGTFDVAVCENLNNTPWSIIMTVAYPWTRNFFKFPFQENQAQFLWYAASSAMIPTMDQINDTLTPFGQSCAGLSLAPLSFFCGNIYQVWSKQTGKDYNYIINNVDKTPWQFWFTPNSTILKDQMAMQSITTGGLVAYTRNMGSQSPDDIYRYLFDKTPPPQNSRCSTSSKITSILSGLGTGLMIPMSLGVRFASPVGAAFFLGMGALGAYGSSASSFNKC
jgi:hypothetical protein